MSERISKNQMLAHIAAIADKSKVEDSDFLFFKNGIYKGEWNPNTSPNQLPNNKVANAIYLISENGSYFGKNLAVGELVRYDNDDKPILIYSKYLPIPFFLSIVDEADTPVNAGGGFVFGGDWDATPTINAQDVIAFDSLYNCTYENNTLTANSSSFLALVENISSVDSGTNRNFRFTWPTATNAYVLVGFMQSELTGDVQQILSDQNAKFIAIGSIMGSPVLYTKSITDSVPVSTALSSSPSVGDVIRLSYRAATQTLYFYNETNGDDLLAIRTNLSEYFMLRPSLFVGAINLPSVECTFDDMGGYPLQQDNISFEFPDDLTKTYFVANSTQDSVINNKRINTTDFVNFINDGGDVVDIMISRLVTDSYIQAIVTGMLNQPSITSLEMINPIGDGVTIVTLENANEINIVINGEYDPAPQFNFNLHDNCFTQGRLVSLRLNALIAITLFSIEYSTYYGQQVILENIAAETSWVFVFEKRGSYVELISKYQV